MTRESVEEKLARRPVFVFRPDHSGTTVRCRDGFSRVRRDCAQLEDGRWEYVGNSAKRGRGAMSAFQESTGSLAWRLKQEQFREARLERERAVAAAQENAQAASARVQKSVTRQIGRGEEISPTG